MPIIRTLREALAGDRQRAVYGIVNGTCNYILTTMARAGPEFADVLAEAQRSGLAEADPSLDVGGHDAAHKLCLLVTLAFGVAITPRQIHTEGITRITLADIGYARELGFTVKLLAIAKQRGRRRSRRGSIPRWSPAAICWPAWAAPTTRSIFRAKRSARRCTSGWEPAKCPPRRPCGRYPGNRADAPGRRRTAPATIRWVIHSPGSRPPK